MDSPGHTAQYCSYTFMENNTKTILCIITMDKRATDRKSTNLEKACFVKALKFLLDKRMKIVEVVTDAHVQVAALMSKYCPILFMLFHQCNLTKLCLVFLFIKDRHSFSTEVYSFFANDFFFIL